MHICTACLSARRDTVFIYTHVAHDTVHTYLIQSQPHVMTVASVCFMTVTINFVSIYHLTVLRNMRAFRQHLPVFWVKSVPLHPDFLFSDDMACWSVWWLNCTSRQFWMITVCNWVINICSSFFTCSTFSHQPFVLESHCSPPTKLRFPGALRTVTAAA